MTGAIVLAAGGSRRMGRPKQLLPFGGGTLLRHACRTVLDTPFRPVVVVLGAEAERCREEIGHLPVQVVVNPHWDDGMAGSLRAGIEALEGDASVEAALVVLADQPRVTADDLVRLAALATADVPAAAGYGEVVGVPAVFPRRLFGELKALEGDTGARKVLARHAPALLPLPGAGLDLDTPADYARLV